MALSTTNAPEPTQQQVQRILINRWSRRASSLPPALREYFAERATTNR